MEKIIKKAIRGGYEKQRYYFDEFGNWDWEPYECIVCSPLFWQALGKACGWNDENKWRMIGGVAHKINMETSKYIPIWIYHALRFHEINLTQGWDKAVEWLIELVGVE